MEAWRRVLRLGLLPLLTTRQKAALARALDCDDARLLQGATTAPPPLSSLEDWPVSAACPLGFAGWQGGGRRGEVLRTVADVEEHFADLCFQIDQECQEASACRFFLNWWDETPRDEARRELLKELLRELDLDWNGEADDA